MKARRVKGLAPAAPLAENAARIVRVRLAELRGFASGALQPHRGRDQHDMRIAAKRLRYVLEATEPCFGTPARAARRAARDLQEVLGELHDCDVMVPLVEEHVGRLRERDVAAVRELGGGAEDLDPRLAARAPHRTAYRGLEVLEVYLAARRRLLFDRFRQLWSEHEERGTWERLDGAARELLRAAKRRRRAAAAAAEPDRDLAVAERERLAAEERVRAAATDLAAADGVTGASVPGRM